MKKDMKILSLSIRQQPFDDIVRGVKKFEYREIRPSNIARYARIGFESGKYEGKEFDISDVPEDANLAEDGILIPVVYDALKLLTGAYANKRPYIIIEVKNALIVRATDANGEPVTLIEQGEEYNAFEIEYELGEIIERSEY